MSNEIEIDLGQLKVGDKVVSPDGIGVVERVISCMEDTWLSAHVSVDGKHVGALQGAKTVKVKVVK